MTTERVQAWLDAYVEAWRTYDADAIGALFSEDATYAYTPFGEPLRGRAAIVESWRTDNPDEPGSWEAAYAAQLVDGDRAAATGETRYAGGERFSNVFLMRFDADGRCSDFVELFMQHPG
jgi:uncharacterized protein (TIGR02246 family)